MIPTLEFAATLLVCVWFIYALCGLVIIMLSDLPAKRTPLTIWEVVIRTGIGMLTAVTLMALLLTR